MAAFLYNFIDSCRWLASKVISFDINGSSPIAMADRFPLDVPVAFITSKVDREVPAECTKNLVRVLVNREHHEVYLLELKYSSHPRYMFDSHYDINRYRTFVHALYQKYNLPFINDYALRGGDLLDQCHILASAQLDV